MWMRVRVERDTEHSLSALTVVHRSFLSMHTSSAPVVVGATVVVTDVDGVSDRRRMTLAVSLHRRFPMLLA